MRKHFEQQLTLGVTPISKVKIPHNPRNHMANLLAALKYIFITPKWNKQIFELLEEKIQSTKKKTGRNGMSLWEIFILAQTRLCMNLGYDELHDLSNYHTLLRGIMGVQKSDFSEGRQYSYQNIYDNISLLDDDLLKGINKIILKVGHEIFKKKSPELSLKIDSFVVETNTHFPTDYGLLWDCIRKCINTIEKLGLPKWRKSKDWKGKLKSLMRELGRVSGNGGKNKTERLIKSAKVYLEKTCNLNKKIEEVLNYNFLEEKELELQIELLYYHEMLLKHIDLIERRIIKGEKIPHGEKLISIFQPFVEMINKGKRNVEIGKKVAITTEENNLIVDWKICNKESDSEILIPIIDKLLSKYKIKRLSVDKGFSSKENKELLSLYIEKVIMPKKGKLNKEEKEEEREVVFKRYRKRHSAIESNINELEHRGLNRCPDRKEINFNRYVALACTAYNLHKIGQAILRKKARSNIVLKQTA
ncbi:MAG: ISNCY family transposase [Candidatus Thermoplasmatota archaeon]